MSRTDSTPRAARLERLARISLFAALALVLSYIETMIPLPVAVPGIKLGLANVAVLVALFTLDARSALAVAVVKVLAAGLLFGSPMMLAYSAGGTALAFAGMLAFRAIPGMGLVPTSMVAAILHNMGQLLVACLMLGTAAVMMNLPVLALAACITGALMGLVAQGVLDSLEVQGEGRPVVDLSGVSLAPGTCTAFVGANGSGKTSAALQLAGVAADGMAADGPGSVGLVLQDPDNQIVAPVVRDDVAFGLENRGVDVEAMSARIHEALESQGVASLADRQVESLSGGQKQHVAIAGVLVLTPDLIVFDEATSMLDPVARRAFRRLVEDLCRRGLAVVTITQMMDEVFAADHIVVFDKGAVVAQGSPEHLLANLDLAALGLQLPATARFAAQLQGLGANVDLTTDPQDLEEQLWRLYARA